MMDRSVKLAGRRSVRLADVAKAASVAKSTAAQALSPGSGGRNVRVSEATARRIRTIADELGYRPNYRAQALARQKPHAVGILFARSGPFFTGLYGRLLELLPQHLLEHDLNLVLIPAVAEPEVWQGQLMDQRVDGCFIMQPMPAAVGEVLQKHDLPGVILNDRHPEVPVPQVLLDDAAGASAIAEHLIGLGHRRIAWLGPSGAAHYSNAMRPTALARKLADAGLPPLMSNPGESPESVAARFAADPDRPTAVVCHADNIAVYFVSQLQKRGFRVPEDISVVGFNDEEYVASLNPPLTTIRPDLQAMSRTSVRLLVRAMSGAEADAEPQEHWIGEQLIIRGSTAAPSLP